MDDSTRTRSAGPAEGSHVEDGVVEHPTAEDFTHARALPEDRVWFKKAVVTEFTSRDDVVRSSSGGPVTRDS